MYLKWSVFKGYFLYVVGHVMDECMGLPKEKQGEVSTT